MSSDLGKEFQVALERWRRALLSHPDLSAGAVKVAFVMLEWSNRERFDETGRLYSWVAEETIAVLSQLSAAGVRKARGILRAHGVYQIESGGKGPGKPTLCFFDPAWLSDAERAMQSSGLVEVWQRGRQRENSPGVISKNRPADRSLKSPARISLPPHSAPAKELPANAKEILPWQENSPAGRSKNRPTKDTYPPDVPSRKTLLSDPPDARADTHARGDLSLPRRHDDGLDEVFDRYLGRRP
jgi:hypothetical protein